LACLLDLRVLQRKMKGNILEQGFGRDDSNLSRVRGALCILSCAPVTLCFSK
jgi:hypothetical protein